MNLYSVDIRIHIYRREGNFGKLGSLAARATLPRERRKIAQSRIYVCADGAVETGSENSSAEEN